MRRTLFATDLDGTLLNSESVVSATSARLLNESIARDTLFTIATARTPATVVPLMSQIEMQLPGVVMTGGALFDFQKSRITNARFMAPATVAELVARWRKSGLSTFMYTLNADTGMLEVYHIGPMSEREQQFVDERIHTPHKRFLIPPNGDSELPSDLSNVMLFFGLQPTEPARKFYNETIAEVQNIVPQIYHDIFGKEIAEVEVFPKDVSKASALEKLASDLYADRLIVFGDNINDIPMMRLADEAIAVENAVDEVKAIATDIIGHHDTDAVAKFINHHA